MTQDLLLGCGEVGSALLEVLGERRSFVVVDPAKGLTPEPGERIEWAHVAIPYSDSFIDDIAVYIHDWNPQHLVIHSTVKVGVTRKIQRECDYIPTYYSPVRGRHPHLASAIRSFPKYYATDIPGQADDEIVAYYANAGIQSRRAPSLEVLEWLKLVETFTYGYELVLWQELERQAASLPGTKHVNLSAAKNWLFEKRRCYDGDIGLVPILDLVPGGIGGHCVIENWTLLRDQMTPELYAWLMKSNGLRKEK